MYSEKSRRGVRSFEDEQLVAAGFFLKHQEKVSILFSATDIKNRANGANTFLIDEAIKRYISDYSIFNFGGSSIPSIAAYFLSFGAETRAYKLLKINRLPSFLKK
ncbi:MAG: hypothetical protein HC798_04360 [Polaribacter sp.]|nr:hypothetical protein [Polaribacter sp.]